MALLIIRRGSTRKGSQEMRANSICVMPVTRFAAPLSKRSNGRFQPLGARQKLRNFPVAYRPGLVYCDRQRGGCVCQTASKRQSK
jgi:hypothetical protein